MLMFVTSLTNRIYFDTFYIGDFMELNDFIPGKFIKHDANTDVAWELMDIGADDIGLVLTLHPWNIAGEKAFPLGLRHIFSFTLKEENFHLWGYREDLYSNLSEKAQKEGRMTWEGTKKG